ncbi:MAG: 50S ribosomal protein L18 [bacterium]|nr:50S ribosomal protein L18 [bacterium]
MDPQIRRAKRITRHRRVRAKVSGVKDRPRLSVFRSNKNVFLQLVDDSTGKTLVSASSHEAKDAKGKTGKAKAAAKLLADRAMKAGIAQVVFDRGGYKFHGRVKAVAETAVKGGLKI